eukprot:CAMPEP_0198203982 /NCGR_PEP_ID=MMETSP1445-20131203/7316_1 /TAXON_ID=36898 /ORGANISM="Pyramimonas sp., Strain CCMP2087" /LENGTH=305 /DNA_ID=CAMNT_0043875599 /DNA_START=159 /DNA_END=1073 /DNA_ORIENTATION=-
MDGAVQEEKRCCFCHEREGGPKNGSFTFPELTQLLDGDGASTRTNFVHMECAAFSDGVRLLIGPWNPIKYKGGIPPTLTSKIAEEEVSRAADHKCTVCHQGTATIGCKEPTCGRYYHFHCASSFAVINKVFFSGVAPEVACHEHRGCIPQHLPTHQLVLPSATEKAPRHVATSRNSSTCQAPAPASACRPQKPAPKRSEREACDQDTSLKVSERAQGSADGGKQRPSTNTLQDPASILEPAPLSSPAEAILDERIIVTLPTPSASPVSTETPKAAVSTVEQPSAKAPVAETVTTTPPAAETPSAK